MQVRLDLLMRHPGWNDIEYNLFGSETVRYMSVQIYYRPPALPLHSIHIYPDLRSSARPTPRLGTIPSAPHPNPL